MIHQTEFAAVGPAPVAPQQAMLPLSCAGVTTAQAGAEPFLTLPRLRPRPALSSPGFAGGAAGVAERQQRDHAQHGGGVFSLIQAERARQAEKFGHTQAADDARDLFEFSKGAGRLLHSQNEMASLHRIADVRRHAIKLAAYTLALAESCTRRMALLPPPNS